MTAAQGPLVYVVVPGGIPGTPVRVSQVVAAPPPAGLKAGLPPTDVAGDREIRKTYEVQRTATSGLTRLLGRHQADRWAVLEANTAGTQTQRPGLVLLRYRPEDLVQRPGWVSEAWVAGAALLGAELDESECRAILQQAGAPTKQRPARPAPPVRLGTEGAVQ